MKKLFLLCILMQFFNSGFSQFVYKIKADSVLITNNSDTCSAELNLENSTKNVLGFLYNKGRGRTEFRKAVVKINDTLCVIGGDTLNLSGSGLFWKLLGNASTNPSLHFLGTTDAQRLVFRTDNVERATIDEIGNVGIGVSSPSTRFDVALLEGTSDGRAMSRFYSDDTWQTNIRIDNTTSDKSYTLLVGGSANEFPTYGVGIGNFAIAKSNMDGSGSTIPFIIDSTDRVGIGAVLGGTNNLPKAALDVSSTNSGILIPRLTNSLRNGIVSNDLHNGLLIYNTDIGQFQFYNGFFWKTICDSCSLGTTWNLGGNAGTNPTTNFLGTTDAQRLVFRTNNIQRATIDTLGNVGVNTNTPTARFHVDGTGRFSDDVTFEGGAALNAITGSGTVINLAQADSTQRLYLGRLDGRSSGMNLYGTDVGFGAGNTGGIDFEVSATKNPNASMRVFTTQSSVWTQRLSLNKGYFDLNLLDSFTVGVTSGIYRFRNLPITTDTSNKIASYNPTTKELKYMNKVDLVAHTTGILPAANGGANYTVQSLTDGSTITWNVANGINGVVTLGGTGRTLSISNPVAGQTYTIRIIQDGTGNRTITTWPTNTKWPHGNSPVLSTIAGRYDIVVFYYDGTNYYGTYQQNFQ